MTDSFIRVLDEKTINQIAAGEVIEQAASVVKELVENALDAKATSISIETKAGGRGLIRIADNGLGMNQDDLLLSIERHATSKILSVDDLNTIDSLGFRGEALPSIASISKMSLQSCSDALGLGNALSIEGGKILDLRKIPRTRGTSVEVRSLFYNVPVRKKFQKSVAWDTAEIHKVLIQTALCHFETAFSWINDDKTQFEGTADDSLLKRIETLLGTEEASKMLLVEHEQKEMHLFGYIGRPKDNRPNRTGQHLFVNKRAIFSPFISKKISEGFGNRLAPHRYPLFVLHLFLPPAWVDVNVHPQKKEVRLQEIDRIGSFLIDAIEKSLQPSERPLYQPIEFPTSIAAEPDFFYYTPEIKQPTKEEKTLPLEMKIRVIGKIGCYLLVEDEQGVLVVDSIKARARVIYEQLLKKKNAKVDIQNLLLPYSLHVNGAEKTLLLHSFPAFEALGISIRHFGGDTFIIDAIPSCLDTGEIQTIIQGFFEEGTIESPWDEKKAALCLTGKLTKGVSSLEEGLNLIRQLFLCEIPDETPDGQPLSFLWTEGELSKRIKNGPNRKS